MSLYDALKVPRNASSDQIRDAYKKLVRTEHPDKGGDAENFKKIQKAYDILKDDNKRMMYDQTGNENEGGGQPQGPGMDFGNIFNMFGGGGMPGMPGVFPGGFPGMNHQQQSQIRKKKNGKAPARVTQLPLNLRDFTNGRVFRIQLERQKFCKECKGEGSTSLKSCSPCNGSGQRTQHIQMGPFMMQNTGPCDICGGQGKQKGDSCWECKGAGLLKEEKSLEIRIEPGMAPGNTIVFSGESSDSQDYTESGDVIIELQSSDEKTPWVRKGDDLHSSVTITFAQSLVGCKIAIESHPSFDTRVVFSIKAGVINGEELRIAGYGMPKRGSSAKGDAVLTVNIAKPNLSEKECLQKTEHLLKSLFSISELPLIENDHIVL
jgi:molecular chaperone DnaJ